MCMDRQLHVSTDVRVNVFINCWLGWCVEVACLTTSGLRSIRPLAHIHTENCMVSKSVSVQTNPLQSRSGPFGFHFGSTDLRINSNVLEKPSSSVACTSSKNLPLDVILFMQCLDVLVKFLPHHAWSATPLMSETFLKLAFHRVPSSLYHCPSTLRTLA